METKEKVVQDAKKQYLVPDELRDRLLSNKTQVSVRLADWIKQWDEKRRAFKDLGGCSIDNLTLTGDIVGDTSGERAAVFDVRVSVSFHNNSKIAYFRLFDDSAAVLRNFSEKDLKLLIPSGTKSVYGFCTGERSGRESFRLKIAVRIPDDRDQFSIWIPQAPSGRVRMKKGENEFFFNGAPGSSDDEEFSEWLVGGSALRDSRISIRWRRKERPDPKDSGREVFSSSHLAIHTISDARVIVSKIKFDVRLANCSVSRLWVSHSGKAGKILSVTSKDVERYRTLDDGTVRVDLKREVRESVTLSMVYEKEYRDSAEIDSFWIYADKVHSNDSEGYSVVVCRNQEVVDIVGVEDAVRIDNDEIPREYWRDVQDTLNALNVGNKGGIATRYSVFYSFRKRGVSDKPYAVLKQRQGKRLDMNRCYVPRLSCEIRFTETGAVSFDYGITVNKAESQQFVRFVVERGTVVERAVVNGVEKAALEEVGRGRQEEAEILVDLEDAPGPKVSVEIRFIVETAQVKDAFAPGFGFGFLTKSVAVSTPQIANAAIGEETFTLILPRTRYTGNYRMDENLSRVAVEERHSAAERQVVFSGIIGSGRRYRVSFDVGGPRHSRAKRRTVRQRWWQAASIAAIVAIAIYLNVGRVRV